jgi:hypothetical protein
MKTLYHAAFGNTVQHSAQSAIRRAALTATACMHLVTIFAAAVSAVLNLLVTHTYKCKLHADHAVTLPLLLLPTESFKVQDWEIYCPDTDCVLALSSELVYDDCPWLTREKANAAVSANSGAVVGRKKVVPKDVRYVHSKVSTVCKQACAIVCAKHCSASASSRRTAA